jgi:aspartyl-tRNA(Asn)/glutamyl-tRNA(Gln) amidotransferase subunit A
LQNSLPLQNHSEKLQQIINGELSLRENVAYFLQRISDNSHLNAFNQVFAEEVIHQAEIIEKKIKERKHGKLAGLVIAVKDVLSIKDKLTTCSSNILKNFTSILHGNLRSKLIDEDAIVIAKLIVMNLQWVHQMKTRHLVLSKSCG